MQPSPELKELTRRLIQAAAAGDTAFFDGIYSREAGTLQIGTDPDEWWHGWEAITGVWRSQIEAMGGGMPVFANDAEAWQEGEIGWAAVNGAIRGPGQPDVPLRFTAVFRRENGDWRIVQGHGSIGVSNEATAFGDVPV